MASFTVRAILEGMIHETAQVTTKLPASNPKRVIIGAPPE